MQRKDVTISRLEFRSVSCFIKVEQKATLAWIMVTRGRGMSHAGEEKLTETRSSVTRARIGGGKYARVVAE